MQVGSARANSISEIHFISVFCIFTHMENVRMDTEIRAIIKHGQGAKDLLENRLSRLAMEMKQINRILQIPVSIFDSPAQMVKLFQLFGWKLLRCAGV